MHRAMKIGARVWKTAVAVAVALGISRALGIEHPVFAGVAAIICMQPTVSGSLRAGRERMQATVMGAAFSLSALVLLEHIPVLQAARAVFIGVTVLVVMGVTIRLKWFDSLVLAAATVVVIMVLPAEENIYTYSLSRTGVTFIGIVVAAGVNLLLVTPRYRLPLWQRLVELTTSTEHIYRQAVEAFCFRKLDLAEEALKGVEESNELQQAVTTRMHWLEEDAQFRRSMHWKDEQEVDILRKAVDAITRARQSTGTIASVTQETLSKHPKYVSEPSRAYEILWELAQLSFTLFDQVQRRLLHETPPSGETVSRWTDEMHKCLIKGIREAHAAPLDIFPLVEVSVVAFEVRRVTELVANLADALASEGG